MILHNLLLLNNGVIIAIRTKVMITVFPEITCNGISGSVNRPWLYITASNINFINMIVMVPATDSQ